MDTAGTGMVAKIIGDADRVFEQVDIDGNGTIDGDELKQLFDLLQCRATPSEFSEVFVELDTNGDGVVSRYFLFFLVCALLENFGIVFVNCYCACETYYC